MATPENMVRRILVVDDEPLVCDSLRMVLELDHHQVQTTNSGHEALAAIQNGKYDLIILDYEMPVMKGDKLAAAIKALSPQQPIIMITGYAEKLRLAGNFPLAVDSVINKPFEIQEIRDAVRKAAAKP